MANTTELQDVREAISHLKRERIVAAAVDLFYRQGYGKTTLEQVANELQVTKPFIYAHFASKNELLVEICSRAINLAHESLNRAMAKDASATERLETVVRDFLTAVLTNQPTIEALQTRQQPRGAGGACFFLKLIREITLQITVVCRQHIFAARIGQPLCVLRQITPIGIQRVTRQAVLQPQRVAEFVYELRVHLNCGEQVHG